MKNEANLPLRAYMQIGFILSILICTFSLNNYNAAFPQTIESNVPTQMSSNETSNSNNGLIITTETNGTESTNTLIARLLSYNLEDRLQRVGSILNVTSKLPQVRNTSFAYLLNETLSTLHGIPQDADIDKRQVAQNILSSYKDLFEILFFIPNGDAYIHEPYSRQQALTRTNFAFRGYFQGAISTNDTYLGNVVNSTAFGTRIAMIAVPVYSLEENNSTLVGVWAGGLDFNVLNEELQSLNLTAGQRVVYVDHNGSKIADSDKNRASQVESFANLNSFRNAITNGQSGSTIETIGNANMLITYKPINLFHNTWVVLLMQQQPSPPGNQTINSGQ